MAAHCKFGRDQSALCSALVIKMWYRWHYEQFKWHINNGANGEAKSGALQLGTL